MKPIHLRAVSLPGLSCRHLSRLVLAVAAILLATGSLSRSVESPLPGQEILLETYRRIESKLERSAFGLPLLFESADRDDRLHADVYGIIAHPFDSVRHVLEDPANWCDIASLHPNVKAATYREISGLWELTFYLGRKILQSPEAAHRLTYRFRRVEDGPGYLAVGLNAGEGPYGTKDHRMGFEALPVEGGRTFLHVSYSYGYGRSLHLAQKAYFTTLGRNKVGFTVKGTDGNGKPVYIGGPRGAIERNVVRYYLAIQSFLDTMPYPEEDRFDARLNAWYDLTTRFNRQLFELEKKDYIAFKTTERKNQAVLQRRILASLP